MLLISKEVYLAWGNIWVYFVKWEITEESPLRSACTTMCACVCAHTHTHMRECTHTCNCYDFPPLYTFKYIKRLEVGNLPTLPFHVSLLLPSVSTITDYNQLQSTFLFKTHWQWWKIYFSSVTFYVWVTLNTHLCHIFRSMWK